MKRLRDTFSAALAIVAGICVPAIVIVLMYIEAREARVY
jgi:hypothetical protein